MPTFNSICSTETIQYFTEKYNLWKDETDISLITNYLKDINPEKLDEFISNGREWLKQAIESDDWIKVLDALIEEIKMNQSSTDLYAESEADFLVYDCVVDTIRNTDLIYVKDWDEFNVWYDEDEDSDEEQFVLII